jgi:hypothetical protein
VFKRAVRPLGDVFLRNLGQGSQRYRKELVEVAIALLLATVTPLVWKIYKNVVRIITSNLNVEDFPPTPS